MANISIENKTLNVLDFGGGGGYHYFIARLILDKNIKIKWKIVETSSMVNAGNEIANDELSFYETIEAAKKDTPKFDLVLASSSLQYLSNQFEIIKELIDLESKYIFITRTPFSLDEPVNGTPQYSYFSSNGPGPLPKGYKDYMISYPIYVLNKQVVENLLSLKYTIRFKLNEAVGGFTTNGKEYDTYGMFCELK